MTSIAVAIKTADRGVNGSRNYLGDTLDNLERAGVFRSPCLHGPVTLIDTGRGESPGFALRASAPYGEHTRVDYERPRTMHENATHAIRTAASAGADFALVLEDDIDVCDRFLDSVAAWLEDHARPDPMMYSFGANYGQIRAAWQRGHTSWDYPVGAFYGALACAWSRASAEDLLEWYGPDPHYPKVVDDVLHKIRDCGHDLRLGHWGRERGLTHFLASAPCFVQHVGHESGIGNRKIQYAGWAGRGWSYVDRQTDEEVAI